jgi:hypothetical protein
MEMFKVMTQQAQAVTQAIQKMSIGSGPSGKAPIPPNYKLPSFSGAPTESFDHWRKEFETFCRAMNMSDQAMANYLPMVLTGRARIRYDTYLNDMPIDPSTMRPRVLNWNRQPGQMAHVPSWSELLAESYPADYGLP